MTHLIGCALILMILIFVPSDVTAEILLQEDFESDLDLTTKWQTGHPKFVYPKDGILYLNQKKSGGDYVSIRSFGVFSDVIIYYEWFIIEWSGQGDGGGALRQAADGSYWMRWWGRSNVKVTTHKDGPAPINAWQPFPVKGGQASANYHQASDYFILKAALMTREKRVTIHIWMSLINRFRSPIGRSRTIPSNLGTSVLIVGNSVFMVLTTLLLPHLNMKRRSLRTTLIRTGLPFNLKGNSRRHGDI